MCPRNLQGVVMHKYDNFPLIGHLFKAFNDYENNIINLERLQYVIRGTGSAMEGNYPDEIRHDLDILDNKIDDLIYNCTIERQRPQALTMIAGIKEKWTETFSNKKLIYNE